MLSLLSADILTLQGSLQHTSNPAMGAISKTSQIDTSSTVIASGDVMTVHGVNTLQGGTVHSKGLTGLIAAASHPSECTTKPKHQRVFGAAHHSEHPLRDVQGIPVDEETPSAPPDTHTQSSIIPVFFSVYDGPPKTCIRILCYSATAVVVSPAISSRSGDVSLTMHNLAEQLLTSFRAEIHVNHYGIDSIA